MKNINKKGFTLVELLAVIVILALIMGIAVFSIGGIINKASADSKSESITMILKAAKTAMVVNNISLPATFNISSEGLISLSTNSNIKVEYDKGSFTGGQIYIDQAGHAIALGVTMNDNYTCTMAMNQNGCGKAEAKKTIIANTSSTYLKDDPNEATRKVFVGSGDNTPNRIMLKENGTDVLYRIVSLETDGSIKVIRDTSYASYAYDSRTIDQTSGPRKNNANSYCNYAGDTYYGCNAWQAVSGNFNNAGLTGTVTVDSEIKTRLNNEFYNRLDTKVKENIVSHNFSLSVVSYNSSTGTGYGVTEMYNRMHGLSTYVSYKNDVETQIGLLYVRDYFLASGNSYIGTPTCKIETGEGGYYKSGATYYCSQDNYLHNGTYWWTMSPYAGYRFYVFFVDSTGRVNHIGAYYGLGVRPVFYLSSNISLIGNGTSGNEYKLN